MYFRYGEKEISYLKSKCPRLARAIDEIGFIKREVDSDLFSAVVHQIVGQQISNKALHTIWTRLQNTVGSITADNLLQAGEKRLQSCGLSRQKINYILGFSGQVKSGAIDLESLWQKDDETVIQELCAQKGIGVWTAEMLLLFCMQRKNVFSYQDLAIQRGLKLLYHHRKITRPLFEKYRRKFSPYGSVASLYLWAIAGGQIRLD